MRSLATAVLAAALTPALAAQNTLYTWTGNLPGDEFGSTIENVGDVDGDGVDDLAVGTPDADRLVFFPFPVTLTDVGNVTVFSGATGDQLWSVNGPTGQQSEYGFEIARAGDLNDDGLEDIFVGAPSGDGAVAGTGFVDLLSGANGSLIRHFPGFQVGSRFGDAICAGDMDNAGGPEVAIGAPYFDLDDNTGGFLQEGFVYVFHISDGSFAAFLPGTHYAPSQSSAEWTLRSWGDELVYVGDVDFDGFGEFAASAPFSTQTQPDTVSNSGFVRLVEPLGNGLPVFEVLTVEDGPAGSLYGRDLEPLRTNFAGSGNFDILVSSPGTDTVEILDPAFNDPFIGWQLADTIPNPCDEPFTSISPAGDFDDDGQLDVAFGAPGAGPTGVGSVCVVSTWFHTEVATIVGEPGERFGWALASFDADGIAGTELAVGARLADAGEVDNGDVTVYEGLGCQVLATEATYGSGLAGTLGTPSITVSGPPVIGSTIDVTITNSAGLQALAFAFVGFAQTAIPAKGGTVLVVDPVADTLVLPVGGIQVPFVIPDDESLCGVDLFLQIIQVDNGAPLNAAFSPGLALTFGND